MEIDLGHVAEHFRELEAEGMTNGIMMASYIAVDAPGMDTVFSLSPLSWPAGSTWPCWSLWQRWL